MFCRTLERPQGLRPVGVSVVFFVFVLLFFVFFFHDCSARFTLIHDISGQRQL